MQRFKAFFNVYLYICSVWPNIRSVLFLLRIYKRNTVCIDESCKLFTEKEEEVVVWGKSICSYSQRVSLPLIQNVLPAIFVDLNQKKNVWNIPMAVKIQEVKDSVMHFFFLRESWLFNSHAELVPWKTKQNKITKSAIFLLFKRMSYLIKLTLSQSSCGDFALLFSRIGHGVPCSMSITCWKSRPSTSMLYVHKENVMYIMYIVVNTGFTLSNSIL